MGRIVPICIAKEFMQKCYFLLYTPLEIEISTARSVRKSFCSILFFGQNVDRNDFRVE